MLSSLRKLEPWTYVLFRVVVGALFVFHGLQKLFGLFGGQRVDYFSRLGAAGVIEAVCGALVAVGFYAAPAALVASGEMFAAYYLAHLGRGWWPIQNGGELALLYAVSFLYIACRKGR